jgi:hypothetical protein
MDTNTLYRLLRYGSTYPALSTESDKDGDARCAFIHFVTALEALVGVVYAGFTGAIIFAKVTRITQRADVRFSTPLTVTFGSGVEARLVNEGKDGSRDAVRIFGDDAEEMAGPSPFPVLTFRIANTMHEMLGAEIISARLNVAAVIENDRHQDQVSEELAKAINRDRMARRRSTWETRRRATASESERSNRTSVTERISDATLRTSVTERMSDATPENALTNLRSLNEFVHKGITSLASTIVKINEEEEVSAKKPPRITFAKLDLDEPEHPLFKRIWKINHVIDQDSPLLTAEAKRAILNNNGQWPRKWNNHQAVRRAVRFKQLVVSFTGLSNLTGGEFIGISTS